MTVQLIAGGAAGASFSGTVGVQLAELELRLPSLQAELAGALNLAAGLQANVALDPTAIIQASLTYAADAMAAIALSVPALKANLALGLGAQLDVVAKLQADIGALTAQIGLLNAQLSALAGVYVYLYTGPPDQLGSEIGARVAADIDTPHVVAPVLVAASAASADVVVSALGIT